MVHAVAANQELNEFGPSPVHVFFLALRGSHLHSPASELRRRASVHVLGEGSGANDIPRGVSPQVIVVDATVAVSTEEIVQLIEQLAESRVVVVGAPESAVLDCLEAGAAGFVGTPWSIDELVDAIQSAPRDELVLSPRATHQLARRVALLASAASTERNLTACLTARQRDVFALVADGLSDKEIAARLVIRPKTAKHHVHDILGRLNVTTRGQAAALVRGRLPREGASCADRATYKNGSYAP